MKSHTFFINLNKVLFVQFKLTGLCPAPLNPFVKGVFVQILSFVNIAQNMSERSYIILIILGYGASTVIVILFFSFAKLNSNSCAKTISKPIRLDSISINQMIFKNDGCYIESYFVPQKHFHPHLKMNVHFHVFIVQIML